jgi:hypothetical protein
MKKKLIVSFMLILSFFLFSHYIYAQALVNKDYSLIFEDAIGEEFKSVNAKVVLNPAGNIQINATFQLPKDHELVPKSGTKTIAVRLITNDIFEVKHRLIYITNINPTGRFNVNYHLNGGGNFFPNGWGIYLKI